MCKVMNIPRGMNSLVENFDRIMDVLLTGSATSCLIGSAAICLTSCVTTNQTCRKVLYISDCYNGIYEMVLVRVKRFKPVNAENMILSGLSQLLKKY